jgi:quercetin dioxygenase-like cupin family protein
VPYIVHRNDLKPSPAVERGGQRYDLLGQETARLAGAAFELVSLDPGESTGEHVHLDSEHYIFVLRGNGYLELDGESHPIAQNYVICIEPGEKYAVRNTGEKVLELLEFLIPM